MNNVRHKIVAGNWKMNKTFDEGLTLVSEVLQAKINSSCKVIFCPPFIHLQKVSEIVKQAPNIFTGAQNCHSEESGAYTGEISAQMIKSVGTQYIIIGHSERRQYFNEPDELLAKKVNITLKYNLSPIFCCGEKIDQRQENQHFSIVESQIKNALFHLDKNLILQLLIAYEPVWAIGTGLNATPQQAQEMHFFIRDLIKQKYGDAVSEKIPILYGGSCKPDNAENLFSQKDIDGGLIGGASLKAADFIKIILATNTTS